LLAAGERQAVASLFVIELALLLGELADLVARGLQRRWIGELILRQAFFEPRQVGDDLAAEADQEPGEDERTRSTSPA
jgi:hypothetical protein